MPFLGSTPADQYQSLAKQTITGDGSTAYTLNRSVTNAYDMEVFINNVRQEPDTSYTASGNTITFTAAVTASDSCYLIYQGQSVGSINPPANSVGGTQIQNTSVTNAHLAGSITDAKLHSSLDLSSKTLTMPAGHVIKVVQGFDNTQANTNNTTDTEALTGLRTSITPTSTSSKILVTISYHVVTTAGASHASAFVKRSTDGGSSFSNLSNYLQSTGNEVHRNAFTVGYFGQHTQVILDSPATTSTCIYSIFMRTNGANIRLNDNGAGTRIILQEIAQ